ncbi:MAG: hypothetical protein NTZ33_13155 [Bacteroidetes bacterium]|nr:hypothetical protein [Bacteroidota bacterium]
MKTTRILIATLFIIISFSGCKKDDSTIPSATITRNDYVGNWSCVEVPQAKNQNFDCTISLDALIADNIKISNFANLQGTAYAVVTGKNLVIPKQTINNNTFEGYGTMNNTNYITMHYYVKDNVDSLVYNTNLNRK